MKPSNELPKVVKVIDPCGLVTVVRVTPAGNHFMEVRMVAIGYKDPRINRVMDSASSIRRVWLDSTKRETEMAYCKEGRHWTEIPVEPLRTLVASYLGGPPLELRVGRAQPLSS